MSRNNPANCIRIPALSDNYVWVLHNPETNEVAVVDPGEAEAVISALNHHGLVPTEVVNTHHHFDHTDGNQALCDQFDIPLTAPASELSRIDKITHPVRHGDRIKIAGYDADVIETPGHTTGHVAFYCPDAGGDDGIVFAGDTLFSLGCGRVFEGTMQEMWSSLKALRDLPDNTLVCGGHEYSAANADYVASLNWSRPEAQDRIDEIRALRKDGMPTLPVMLAIEKAANPFLNCDKEDLITALGLDLDTDETDVFTALREGKDQF